MMGESLNRLYNRPLNATGEKLFLYHADGSLRTQYWLNGATGRTTLIRFSNTLCGEHRNLLAHIRDYAPLNKDDWQADIMLTFLTQIKFDDLRLYPDDPQGFRDMWTLAHDSKETTFSILNDKNRSLLDNRDSFRCHWFTVQTVNLMSEWVERLDAILQAHSHGELKVVTPFDGNAWGIELRIVDRTGVALSLAERIVLRSDTLDWRHYESASIHGEIGSGRKWRRTPERLALAVLRLDDVRERKVIERI